MGKNLFLLAYTWETENKNSGQNQILLSQCPVKYSYFKKNVLSL